MEEPKINLVGNIGGGKTQSRSVYQTDGLSPTLNAGMTHGNTIPYVVEKEQVIVAMRGRNPDNPSDRTPGIELEQTLEINSEGIANTLTTVQKDNMVLVRQATKDGLTPCRIGGGGRPELPRQQDKARSSDRERRSLSDTDNGEYP